MCLNTHNWLNQAFAVAEGYLANRIMVHCLVPILIKMKIVKVPSIVHCLVPALIANNDGKSTSAGMDILGLLLRVTIVRFIIQLTISVTMIATMVLLIIL